MQQTTSTLMKEANKVGLYINAEKCKLITTSVWSDRSGCRFSYRKSRWFLLPWHRGVYPS